MKARRIAIVLLAAICFFSAAGAQAFVGISPLYINTADAQSKVTFSGEQANVTAKVIGLSGTTGIIATVTLQRKNADGTYTGVNSWSFSSSGSEATANKTWYVASGYYYRTYLTISVTRGGITEYASATSADTVRKNPGGQA